MSFSRTGDRQRDVLGAQYGSSPQPSNRGCAITTNQPARHLRTGTSTKVKVIPRDIPDQIIDRILHFVFLPTVINSHSHPIQLVSKRLGTLALPYVLRTLSVSSPERLASLVYSSRSPLYFEPRGRHVRCFDLGFIPDNDLLKEIARKDPPFLPNLTTLRFSFTMGVPVDKCAPDEIQASLSEDTLRRAARQRFNPSWHLWYLFLSPMQPRRFEWISDDPGQLYLLGLNRDMNSLFASWKSLSSVYLEGLCLVDHFNLTTWSLAFLAERVHIKAVFDKSQVFFLTGFDKTRLLRCGHLLLEACPHSTEDLASDKEIPVLVLGSTMITLKGWRQEDRKMFRARLTGNAHSEHVRSQVQELPKTPKIPMHSKYSHRHHLLTLAAALLLFVGLTNWNIYKLSSTGIHVHSPFSPGPERFYYIEPGFHEGSWIRRRLLGDTRPLYHSMT